MKNIFDIRRDNLREIAKKMGSKKELGEKLDMESGRISNLIGKNPSKNIGEKLARKIEELLNLSAFYLDLTHDMEAPDVSHNDFSLNYLVPLVDIDNPANKPSLIATENIMGRISFPKQLLQEKHAQLNTSFFLKAKDNSMAPVIENGDYILIDSSKNQIASSRVYAIKVDDIVMIKRLFKEPTGIKIVCDNLSEKFRSPDQLINDESRINVIGKVMMVNKMSEI